MPFEKRAIPVLHLGFHLKSRNESGHAPLYCRLSYNSERTGEYLVGIAVPIDAWNQKTLCLPVDHPQAETIRLRLAEVWDQHERIIMALKSQAEPVPITAALIRERWQQVHGVTPKPRPEKPQASLALMAVYRTFVNYLDTRPVNEVRAKHSRMPYHAAEGQLTAFLAWRGQPHFSAEKVTPGFGWQFHGFLLRANIHPRTATRYLNALRAALQHALLYDRIRVNGLYQFEVPKTRRVAKCTKGRTAQLRALGSDPVFHYSDQLA